MQNVTLTPQAADYVKIEEALAPLRPAVLSETLRACEAYMSVSALVGEDDAAAASVMQTLHDRVTLELGFTPENLPARATISKVARLIRARRVRTP